MTRKDMPFWRATLLVLLVWIGLGTTYATLSPSGINYEVVALMAIKNNLNDPNNVLESWDKNSVDPCSWRMITCSTQGSVSVLGLPSQSLSGTLSSWIGNLSNLQSVLLQNNDISGPIPTEIRKLEKLQTLDLSNNMFSGGIPSLGDLRNLTYLRLNNNSLSGPLPESLSNIEGLILVDISYNGLRGPLPKLSARTIKVFGNPLICGSDSGINCSSVFSQQLSYSSDALRGKSQPGVTRNHHIAVVLGSCVGSACSILLAVGLLLLYRYRNNQRIFFNVNDQCDQESHLGHLKRYSFKELRVATDHFNSKNILGRGGFGIVYKGCLQDGSLVAVKRLNDYNAVGGEVQFQTEVEMISLAVHRNLLRLRGFCTTENERILVYPYMPNGSVASQLRDHIHGKPSLDWSRRKKIALGAARGLLYLHEQCNPKIIHRDVKAANILLDEEFEAVVGDFGLAKLLDPQDSHVSTAVRGTVGHIAPEYLSTGKSSQKTDVFGFGILLLELITGQRAFEFGRVTYQKGVMLDWVRKLHKEGRTIVLVDKDLRNNYDEVELGEMVKIALLCTQFDPCHRPVMSEVLRMLEGDGVSEKWESLQKVDTSVPGPSENLHYRYGDFIQESSVVIEAIELSGPR
ncbi:hypothetical protein ACHQM5_008263 [Ranunculus cassubicifolius]